MGYVKCRSCNGIGKKFFDRYDKNGRYYEKVVDCKACSGTGINQRLYSKNCEKCYAEIVYPRDANFPPKYCRDCKERIQAERERQAAKWKTKSCKKCHQTIKYNVEWNKIPELCKDCIAKEKAKWRVKPCEACGKDIRYHEDWQHIPSLCKECKKNEVDLTNKIKGDWEYLRRVAMTYANNHKGGWSRIVQGSINGHLVTASFGFGSKEGECLICDGHIFDEREFMQHHNHDHYNGGKGPHLFPKSRGKYTGPGC